MALGPALLYGQVVKLQYTAARTRGRQVPSRALRAVGRRAPAVASDPLLSKYRQLNALHPGPVQPRPAEGRAEGARRTVHSAP